MGDRRTNPSQNCLPFRLLFDPPGKGKNGEPERDGEDKEIAVDEIRDGHEDLGRHGQLLVHPVKDLGDHGDHVADKEEENARSHDAHNSGIDQGCLDLCFHVRAALEQVRLILEDRIEGARLLARRHRIDEEVVEYLRVGFERLRERGAAFYLVAQNPTISFSLSPSSWFAIMVRAWKRGTPPLRREASWRANCMGNLCFMPKEKNKASLFPLCRRLLERDQVEPPVLYFVFRG